MGMRVLMAVVVALLMGAAAALAAKEAPVDAAWRACMAQPTRACVAAWAMARVRGIDNEALRARMLDPVLKSTEALRPADTAAMAREAEAIAMAMADDEQRDRMLVGVVKAYVSARDSAAANAVLARFKDKMWEGEGVVQIAIGLGHEKRVDDAVALLRSHRATKDDWQAWSRAAWSLRQVAVARGETAALLALLQEGQPHYGAARGNPNRFGNYHYVSHPTIFVEPLLIVLAEQTAQGQVQEALAIARAVEDKRARPAILGGIAAVLALAGRTDEALEVALAQPVEEQGRIVGAAAQPVMVDPLSDSRYEPGAVGLLTGPFPKIARPAAQAFAASMRLAEGFDAAKDDRDMAYSVIALANAREDAVALAVKAAGVMKSDHRTTLTELGEVQARVGDRAASIKTFARVRELILTERTEPDGWEWREGSLSELARLQARLGQIDEALAIVRAMKGNEMTTRVILNDGRQLSMDSNRRDALYEIARAMAKAGRVDEAFALAREMKHPDLGWAGNGLGVVAEGLAEAGRLDEALVALKTVDDDRARDGAVLYIVRWRLAAGLTGDADRLLAAFADDGKRALAMGEVAAALLRAGDAARALTLVKQALALVDKLSPEPAINALNQAVRGLAA